MKITKSITFLLASLILLSFITVKTNKKEKHFGKITTLLGTYEGEFDIKLNEENKDMISIKVVDVKQKNNGNKVSYQETLSVNPAIIKSFETEGRMYVVKNITQGGGKSFSNCCLRITDTCNVATLGYWGTSTDTSKCFVQAKNSTRYESLKGVSYIGFLMTFSQCPSIKKRIKESLKNYSKTYKDLSRQELIQEWKSSIEEYNNCFK